MSSESEKETIEKKPKDSKPSDDITSEKPAPDKKPPATKPPVAKNLNYLHLKRGLQIKSLKILVKKQQFPL
jgi:hypothetical protein